MKLDRRLKSRLDHKRPLGRPIAPDATEQDLRRALRVRGHRVTEQRLVIRRVLSELNRHVSADEVRSAVGDRLPNLSMPTVYATLELFERLGIVRRVSVGGGIFLYDPRGDDHQHLVCRRCGMVEDLDVRLSAAPAIAAARRRGFAVSQSEIVISGLCRACSRASA
jgi:Fe2+ or Zn2+ uptake regulation protein